MQLNKYTVLEVYSLQSKIILKLLVNIVQQKQDVSITTQYP